MSLLAATVVPPIAPVTFALVNMPSFGVVDATFTSIQVQSSVCTTSITLTPSVTPFGSTSPTSLSWGAASCGAKSMSLTTSNGNPIPTSWTLTFTISGESTTGFLIPPTVLPLLTHHRILSSANVLVNGSLPSINAEVGAGTNGNVIRFNGANTYIDLNDRADSRADHMIASLGQLGGPFYSFSITFWFWWPSTNKGSNSKIFSCSGGGSGANEITIAQNSNNAQFRYSFGVDGVYTCASTFGTTPFIQTDIWNLISYTFDPYGNVAMYLNGVAMSATQPTCALAGRPQLRSTFLFVGTKQFHTG